MISFCSLLYIQKTTAQNISNIVWADSCTSGSFYGRIASPGYSDFSQVHACANGDIMLVGTIKDNFQQMAIAKNYCNVMRLDGAGNLLWTKFIGINDTAIQVDLRTYASVLTANGDLVVVLTVNAPPLSGTYIVRLDGNGKLVWQKRLPYFFNSLSADTYKDVIQTSDGGFLMGGSTIISGGNNNAGLLTKLNADGSFAWRRVLATSSNDITAISEGNEAYYFAGKISISPNDFTENYLARVKKNNGSIDWLKWISFAGTIPLTSVTEYQFEHMNFSNGEIALTGNTRSNYAGASSNAQIALYIDENANVISSTKIENRQIEIDPANPFQGLLYDPFAKTGVQFNNSDSSDNYVFNLGNNNAINWAWRIPMPGAQTATDITVLRDVSVAIAGFSRNPGANVSANLLRTSAAGRLENCINQSYPVAVSPQTVSLQNNQNVWQLLPDDSATITSLLDTMTGKGFSWQLQCNSSNSCRISKIQGSKVVCRNTGNVFALIRDGSCRNIIDFSASTAVGITRLSDSTANITFPSAGNVMLYSTMQSACGILKDSVMIQVKNAVAVFSLGADTSICPQNKIILNAGGGYRSYSWQDGSADSTFTVTAPGKYYVAVTDVCGNLLSDTIQVNPAPAFEFSIGADRIKCNTDTIHIDAPGGFGNYNWSPAWHINSTTGQHVVVDPLIDTTYTVAAEKYPGCIAFDTIRIRVKQSPEIKLGTERQLCLNDTLSLNAGPGFVNYLWSDGIRTQLNLIAQPGVYTVEATDTSGCISTGTVTISNKLCVNDIYIPTAFAPGGNNKILKPSASLPFSKYHFQVFSRWGQQLFETSDINKGWDGKFKGKEISGGVLVWICTYQFEGKQLNVKKGTVVLVR